jgi:hypothetical protein
MVASHAAANSNCNLACEALRRRARVGDKPLAAEAFTETLLSLEP